MDIWLRGSEATEDDPHNYVLDLDMVLYAIETKRIWYEQCVGTLGQCLHVLKLDDTPLWR